MKKIVIIGGVAGGASCAARLRRLDEEANIIMLERGEYISYANCGLPYHVGDVIKSRDALLLQSPEAMKKKYDIDVRVKNEVTSIDKENKKITVRRLDSGETYEETYDTLVISTGSSPVRPPIPGIGSSRIQTLWTVPDTDRIRALIKENKIKTAAVIGGGFIGLEMAENLRHAGLSVSLIEMLDQVMTPVDYEMAQLLHENILQNGVDLHLGDGVAGFEDQDGSVAITLKSGKTLSAELVILSIGVRPNSELAKAAGLSVNERGGIVVDEYLKTSDPDIYAVGDVIQVDDLIFQEPTMIPLAGPANKQGRIAANNIAGAQETYNKTQGTSVAKVFDLAVASTGANEKALIKRGLQKGSDYESIIITQNSHAGYYPGAVPITLKLLFSADGKKIFGAQIVGRDGVDKRIDTLAVAIRLGAGISDLKSLELAYAPPFSSAKDPVNMAGFVAENLITGKVAFSSWDAVEQNPETVLLDVREDAELMAFSLPNAKHIPLGQLRSRLKELDPSRKIIVFCAIGVRAYNAARLLMQNGFHNVKLYPGGARFYQSTHYTADGVLPSEQTVYSDSGQMETKNIPTSAMRLDCSGMQCPGPIMKVFETMKEMPDGAVMEVSASDPGFTRDIGAWCRRTGNELMACELRGKDYVALVKKGTPVAPEKVEAAEGKTIIVFSGDLDKVLASFIIANGAAAMGRPVTMFFTFWGLTALRKSEKQPVRKSLVESMFGFMLPRGSKKLKLSKMNMGGMGTAMMKKIMNDKNVDSLETLIQKAMKSGVKIVACTMSMDVMGIQAEELIDGVELGGVGAYLGDAEESNVNLFI
ncbi:FAD-dependent oxidoreductase [Lacrimispora celerecrescens]|uniref:Pyridine nucleotide-disulfide oxidoreductase n=1 Tax=Lacrimispora celerecrescens TaxID=29354 RepID=A0A084JS44_9FIRM|nr:FAD-dependent oxidoreductase [Lacrimispora celerecrescens]KEZ91778.1 pyridine nucleotide-disulfide oxidoreductase [Lacrimispora celerecrescens]MBW4848310.1 FAD-dependent oxidoreductase [Lachnospiraceae bacterium]